MINFSGKKGTAYTNVFSDIYATALYDSKMATPTAEELRNAANFLENQAAELEKTGLTDEQEAILEYAEEHSIDAIKIKGVHYNTIRTSNAFHGGGKKGESYDDYEKLVKLQGFRTTCRYNDKCYFIDLVVHKDSWDDLIVSVEYK